MKKLIIDVSNLTISDKELRKTGIQEVIYQVLVNIVGIRKNNKNLRIILLPFLPRDGKFKNSKLFLENPSCVLEQIENIFNLPSEDIWGFDLRGKYNFIMNDDEILKIISESDIFYLQSLYDLTDIIDMNPHVIFNSILYDITPFLLPEYANEVVVTWFNKKYIPSFKKFHQIISISRHGLFDLLDYKFVTEKQKLSYLQLPNYDIDYVELKNSSKLQIIDDKNYFVVLGSIEPRKNIFKLVSGFRLFLSKNPDYHLVFIGKSGWRNEEIFSLVVEDLFLRDHILFTGYLSDKDMYNVVSHALGLCMISNYEGFGLPLSLADSIGIKSLANWGSSLPEASNYNGIYVNTWDEYSIAMGFKYLSENKIKLDRKADYNWKVYCEKLINLIVPPALLN